MDTLRSALPIPYHGAILPLIKPLGWSSFFLVKKLRQKLQGQKIGHGGTLDPLAWGLVLCCTGKQTKKIETLQQLPKTYIGRIVLGATRPSMDLETPIDNYYSYTSLTKEDIENAMHSFIGHYLQYPPIYAAISIGGVKAYKLARAGKNATLHPKKVEIYSFEATSMSIPYIDFKVKCSKGTYIRSLAYDLGKTLGIGAYLGALCRTEIGPYRIEEAFSLYELSS